jgi:hypothetical protein
MAGDVGSNGVKVSIADICCEKLFNFPARRLRRGDPNAQCDPVVVVYVGDGDGAFSCR